MPAGGPSRRHGQAGTRPRARPGRVGCPGPGAFADGATGPSDRSASRSRARAPTGCGLVVTSGSGASIPRRRGTALVQSIKPGGEWRLGGRSCNSCNSRDCPGPTSGLRGLARAFARRRTSRRPSPTARRDRPRCPASGAFLVGRRLDPTGQPAPRAPEALDQDLARPRRDRGGRRREATGCATDQDAEDHEEGEIPIVFRMTSGTRTLPSISWRTT
jgi:hypothetical protein